MRSLATFLLFASASAFAAGEPFTCGSATTTDEQASQLSQWVQLRQKPETTLQKRDVISSRAVNNFVVVRADETTAPFDDPADLEGVSILFRRKNPTKFAVSREPLTYDTAIGPLFEPFDRGETSKKLTLSKMSFPFGPSIYTEMALSVARGIYFENDPAVPTRTLASFELMTGSQPLISPLLDYSASPGSSPEVHIKETSEALTITWKLENPGFVSYDIQATLFATGDIRFSYRTLRQVAWGSVVVTTGLPGGWLAEKATLGSFSDVSDDVEGAFGSSQAMLDIKAVEVSRVGNSPVLEFRIELGAPIVRDELNPNAAYTIFVGDSMNRLELFIRPDKVIYRVPHLVDLVDSAAARIVGPSIYLYVVDDLLALNGSEVKVSVYTAALQNADNASATIDIGTATTTAETDFSEITSFETSRPLVESYSLASVNMEAVWQRVKSDFGYREDQIDAVMVYTPFVTDLITKQFGAFALLSNAGADGISSFSDKDQPRTTTLIHMNRLGAFPEYGTDVQLHEFGHRWLYYFEIREGGANTRSLNPLGYHPAQYVSTPAAFPVHSATDSSCMGGARFSGLGNGMFRTHPAGQWTFGYTWHELYLMGLARADEVKPWYYIKDSDPRLGDEYFPPFDLEVKGERVDVTVDQIVDAMGMREPDYSRSQKQFRVLFVVLERPDQPIPAVDLSAEYRLRFEEAFAKATGGRGQVETAVTMMSRPRRRAVGR